MADIPYLNGELYGKSEINGCIEDSNQIFHTKTKILYNFNINGSGDGSNLLIKPISNVCFSNIGVLCLRGQGLESLDVDFRQLENVYDVDFSDNKLKNLPLDFSLLKNVTNLNLSHNQFVTQPHCIVSSFYHIAHLDMSFNNLQEFSCAPLSLPYLVYLNLRSNCLTSLPLWLIEEAPSALEFLDISLNPCLKSKLPNEFFRMSLSRVVSCVRTLKLASTCFLSWNINALMNFTCLSCLDIGSIPGCDSKLNNLLSNINVQVLSKLPLEKIEAANCALPDIPSDIFLLVHLKVLNLSGNKGMLWFPDSFCQLVTLAILDASKCSLIILPTDIGLMTSLKQLWLSHNQLSSLPESINNLSLEILDVYDNLFEEVPIIAESLSLKGFDIGYNYCDPPQLKKEFGYNCQRDYLRYSLKSQNQRLDEKKVQIHSESSDEESRRYSESLCSYSEHESDWNSHSDVESEEEEWHINDDIDNDFDPNCCLSRWESSNSIELLHKSLELQNCYYQRNFEIKHFHGTAVLDPSSDIEGQFDDD